MECDQNIDGLRLDGSPCESDMHTNRSILLLVVMIRTFVGYKIDNNTQIKIDKVEYINSVNRSKWMKNFLFLNKNEPPC